MTERDAERSVSAPLSPQQEIIAGLNSAAAFISPKYFYDQLGSQLFEAITRLPEYYPTRTETTLMQQHGAAIAHAVGEGATLIEIGAGNCTKALALCRWIQPRCFVGVDISADFLQDAMRGLQQELPELTTWAIAADLSAAFHLPAEVPQSKRLVFYPGSSIGNFDTQQALDLLKRMRALMDMDGGVLIGFDLPKALEVLEAAYDDTQGVTADFNRNVLNHVNHIIGSDFDTGQWGHVAFFNAQASRIEMHLEALEPTLVSWPGGKRSFAVAERIHTENSYKYSIDAFTGILRAAGFGKSQVWTDDQAWFAVIHARP